MRFYIQAVVMLVLVFNGCSSINREAVANPEKEDEIIEISFRGEKKSREELQELKTASRRGDGEAAYALFAYYTIGAGGNGRIGERYLRLAVKREYPPALYNVASDIWSNEKNPDVNAVHRLVSRAIELGYVADGAREMGFPDERDLLEEVELAMKTGVVPKRSKFRLFLD